MTKVIESSLSEKLMENKDFLSIITRQVAIRYGLSIGKNGFASFRASLLFGRTFVKENEIGSVNISISSNGHSISSGKPYVEWYRDKTDLLKTLSAWENSSEEFPWKGTWVSKNPFVGSVALENKEIRLVDADNPVFALYHGVIFQLLQQHLTAMRIYAEVDPKHQKYADTFDVLPTRFSAFVAQTQRKVVTKTFGTIPQ